MKQRVPAPWTVDADGFGDVPITQRMEENDPDLYTHVVAIVGTQQGIWLEERPDMQNHIGEADSSIFWFDHFYPNVDQLLVINDGDAIPIGLMYARERMVGTQFRNVQTLCLKYSCKKPEEGEEWPMGRKPAYDYVDLNELLCATERDAQFTAAGVNNHILPYVMLCILAGNDFFGNYCKGIGLDTIIQTYMEMLPQFANLLQWNNCGFAPSTRDKRRIILDESAFEQLTYHIYLTKYGKAIRKKNKDACDFDLLRVHTCWSPISLVTDALWAHH